MTLITEEELKKSIAECQGQRNPNANTCIMLAAFLIIQKELYGDKNDTATPEKPIRNYSFQPDNNKIDYPVDTEFGRLVDGQNITDTLDIMQELMDTLLYVEPKLYKFVIRKLEEL